MKGILSNGGAIDFGVESRKSLKRAARMLHRGHIWKLVLETPVPRCGWSSYHELGYWLLLDLGLLSCRREPIMIGGEYEGCDKIYTVAANVEFTDDRGNIWAQGAVDEWLK